MGAALPVGIVLPSLAESMRAAALMLLAALTASAHDYSPSCYGWPDKNRKWDIATAGTDLPRLLGHSAPPFALRTLDQTTTIALHDLLETAPVVLQFADYS